MAFGVFNRELHKQDASIALRRLTESFDLGLASLLHGQYKR